MGHAITVGIHQPNFFPWLGYFQKIALSDHFIFLDNVQIQKTGSSYTNRVAINMGGNAQNIVAPISRIKGFPKINDCTFANNHWQTKIIKTLQTNYAKSKFYEENAPYIFEILNTDIDNLATYNIKTIIELSQKMGVRTQFHNASSYDISEDDPTDRLIELVKNVHGNIYLSGKGGMNYQDESRFIQAGINLVYNKKPSLRYLQLKSDEFIDGLSIFDAIFNIGFEALAIYFEECQI